MTRRLPIGIQDFVSIRKEGFCYVDKTARIHSLISGSGKTRETYIEELRRFYNGYRFSRKPLKVYNPFGVINHFDKGGEFLPCWYETDVSTFLVTLIINQKVPITNLRDLWVGYDDLSRYGAKIMKAIPLLYQNGYLTIADYDEECNQFILDYPNEEVRAFLCRVIDSLQTPDESSRALYTQLPMS